MYGLQRAGHFARVSVPRACLITRAFKKNKDDSAKDEAGDSSNESDPDFQMLDVKIAYGEFMRYYKQPEKPEILKRTQEQYEKDKAYVNRYSKIRRDEDAAYTKLFAIKQLHTWEAIFELPPRLFREAVTIDHTVIPTYQPWTDTPPDPKIKQARPPEIQMQQH